jgi:hypothetical protein
MKTIKQISEELGVSKQAVHQKIKRQPLAVNLQQLTATVDGVIYIHNDGVTLIKQAFEGVNPDRQRTVNEPSTVDVNGASTVDALLQIINNHQQTINELISANRELTAALENTTSSLHAAQALHAGTIQKQLTDTHIADEPLPFWKKIFKK